MLFTDLNILVSSSISQDSKRTLEENDAKIFTFDNTDDLKNILVSPDLCVTDTYDKQLYQYLTLERLVPVVSSQWVHKSLSTKKILKFNEYSLYPQHILKNTQIYVSPSSFNNTQILFLQHLVFCLGGFVSPVLTNKVTHIIANSINDEAITAVKTFNINSNQIKWVYPSWLVSCWISSNNENIASHIIISDDPQAYDLSWDNIAKIKDDNERILFLKDKKFILSLDLNLGPHLYTLLQNYIKAFGGIIKRHLDEYDTEAFKQADIYIGTSVSSQSYDTANSIPNMIKGNLIWLLDSWQHQRLLNPKICIWHTPFNRKVMSSKKFTIAYTNFYGIQRYYLQLLIKMLGANCTTELSKKNTHLISLKPCGKKYKKAVEWRENFLSNNNGNQVIILNFNWLIDCYLKNRLMNPTNYTKLEDQDIKNSFGYISTHVKPEDQLDSYTMDEPLRSISNLQIKKQSFGLWKTDENVTPQPQLVTALNSIDVNLSSKDALQPRTSISMSKDSNDYDTFEKSLTNLNDEKYVSTNDKKQNTENIDINKVNSTQSNKNSSYQENKEVEKKITSKEKVSNDILNIPTLENSQPSQKSKQPSQKSEQPPSKDTKSKFSQQTGLPSTPISNNTDSIENLENSTSMNLKPKEPSNISPNKEVKMSNVIPLTSSVSPNSRLAKAKANKRMHTDIESLNEYAKDSKRKKIITAAEEEASKIIKKNSISNKTNYNLHAIHTGCNDLVINDIEKELLRKVGIVLYDDIKDDNLDILNGIIAPKKLRTVKFLKSYSFKPLKFIIQPNFIKDILKALQNGKFGEPYGIDKYRIKDKDIDSIKIMKRTQEKEKIFERANVDCINIIDDDKIPGASIKSILESHGIKNIKIVPKTFEKKDLVKNGDACKYIYILIVNKGTQVKRFKKVMKPDNSKTKDSKNNDETYMAIKWDWCVDTIFNLDVDWGNKAEVLFDSIKQ